MGHLQERLWGMEMQCLADQAAHKPADWAVPCALICSIWLLSLYSKQGTRKRGELICQPV